ncbi:MAG: hypothetical protein M0019_08590 [Actinomycetota bacterium]|nr:hypothetical protein [Actinomycetota bacterium]
MSTSSGPADFASTNDSAVHGMFGADKVTFGLPGALTQAESYSRGIPSTPTIRGEFGVPFLLSTNGEQILARVGAISGLLDGLGNVFLAIAFQEELS